MACQAFRIKYKSVSCNNTQNPECCLAGQKGEFYKQNVTFLIHTKNSSTFKIQAIWQSNKTKKLFHLSSSIWSNLHKSVHCGFEPVDTTHLARDADAAPNVRSDAHDRSPTTNQSPLSTWGTAWAPFFIVGVHCSPINGVGAGISIQKKRRIIISVGKEKKK